MRRPLLTASLVLLLASACQNKAADEGAVDTTLPDDNSSAATSTTTNMVAEVAPEAPRVQRKTSDDEPMDDISAEDALNPSSVFPSKAASSDASLAASGPSDAKSRGNPGTWVTSDDYPSRALREEREGVTAISYTIGVDGRVSNCEITASSGSPDLDQATCINFVRRARYTPAKDEEGDPIQSEGTQRIRWQIPGY